MVNAFYSVSGFIDIFCSNGSYYCCWYRIAEHISASEDLDPRNYPPHRRTLGSLRRYRFCCFGLGRREQTSSQVEKFPIFTIQKSRSEFEGNLLLEANSFKLSTETQKHVNAVAIFRPFSSDTSLLRTPSAVISIPIPDSQSIARAATRRQDLESQTLLRRVLRLLFLQTQTSASLTPAPSLITHSFSH
ncbi:hypothetical protein BT96DRAFT_49718 [Gymnopus androsaceus JB14]|uniref:Uncharacterized protein n=1 Tax=Gymnopus androsaceus JB14 TaxID=1447944 RepID=A0A6A4HJX5_9AGAR|nr:hypothetical protein BT96DRAFT_49718 [Gymnopus androsaceus JB14]